MSCVGRALLRMSVKGDEVRISCVKDCCLRSVDGKEWDIG